MKQQKPSPFRPKPRVQILESNDAMDVIGDLHGCPDEAKLAFESLGHKIFFPKDINEPAVVNMAPGRIMAFLGDITDRGPNSVDTMRMVEGTLNVGGVCVMGNHDNKLLRSLAGHKINVAGGLEKTLEEFEAVAPETRDRWRDMLLNLPHQVKAPCSNETLSQDGFITLTHASAAIHHQDAETKNSAARSMYGYADGSVDSHGNLMRDDWARAYTGARGVLHGHTPINEPRLLNNVGCLDTGAVFGGKMTLLSVDTGTITQVQSGFCSKERAGVTQDVIKIGTPTQMPFMPTWAQPEEIAAEAEAPAKISKSKPEEQR